MRMTFNDGESVNLSQLARDLESAGLRYLDLSSDRELFVLNLATGRVEMWAAREIGCGCDNTFWGDLAGGYEFCRSFDADGIQSRGEFVRRYVQE